MTNISSPSATTGREIAATRLFSAPRALVWETWTKIEHLAQWWGPFGFTITTQQFDPRPGGIWKFVMHGPDGVDYDNEIIYDEVLRPVRIVYTHTSPHFQSTATFTERGDATEVSVRMLFDSAADRDQTIAVYHADEGLQQTLERLGQRLATIIAGA
jgi:uncharacterized protein YndB with AHSA1/START domain